MKKKSGKRFVIAGGILLMAVLMIVIGRRFQSKPVAEDVLPTDNKESSEVTVKTPENQEKVESVKGEVTITVAPVTKEAANEGSGSVDTGTNQTIQPDVSPKPTEREEQGTKPTEKPTNEKAEPTKQEEKEPEVTPTPTAKPEPTPTPSPKPTKKPTPTAKPTSKPEKKDNKKAEEKNSSGGFPGFDNVPDGGDNTVIYGDSDGDIDKQVGDMD